MPFQKSTTDNDIIGMRINDVEVISISGYKGNPPRTYYNVRCCRCGKIFEMRRNKFLDKKHPPVACYECIKNKYNNINYINEIIGKKVNMLTCEEFVGFREVPSSGRDKPRRQAMYRCRCDCGGYTTIDRNIFLSGQVKSCGCQNRIGLIKHGMSRSRLYSIWRNMQDRCSNPNIARYDQYGGRGIYVCQEWLGNFPYEGFMNFYNWAMSSGYNENLSIDRINVNGPYAPWNCRWIPLPQQAWNKTTSLRVQVGNESLSSYDLCERYNLQVTPSELSRRLSNTDGDYDNWSLNDKMFVPAGTRKDTYRKEHNITNPIEFLK